MCGRYTSYTVLTDIQLAFDLDSLGPECESLQPSWNVAPTQDIPIIVERAIPNSAENSGGREVLSGANKEGVQHVEPAGPANSSGDSARVTGNAQARNTNSVVRELHVARWGLVPPWSKDPSKGPQMINARIETLAQKRTFAPSLAKRRCIIPADGYFEWQSAEGGKVPHYIHSTNSELLAFAGLYGWWRKPDGSWLLTATIITRAAEGDLARIHDRTPIVLERTEYTSWLDPAQDDPYTALAIIDRPNRTLQADIVGRAVGNIRNNSPQNIVPVSE